MPRRQKVLAKKVWPFWVRSVANNLHIWLPQRTPTELSTFLNRLTTNARLEFKLAEIGSEYLTQLTTWATQQQAQYPGLQVETVDFSRPGDGARIVDRYVSAADRAVLQRFVSELPRALQPAADRELVPERIQPRFDDNPAPRYRAHLVHRAAVLSGRDIENAELTMEPNSGRYSVLLTFSAEGGQRFGDFTEAHVGERLTIVINGEVTCPCGGQRALCAPGCRTAAAGRASVRR